MNRYKIMTSNGKDPIYFDDTEIEDVLNGIEFKRIFKIKQAFVNPSFIVSIQKVEAEKVRMGGEYNPVTGNMQGGKMEELGFDELEDMFSGTPLQLEDKNKKLN